MSQATLTDLCRRAAGSDAQPDGDLLRRFSQSRDQTAFATLVRRHGRVVWGAAVRRTGDHQAAEDVFQATFLALARRAGRLHGRTSLSGWLYTVSARLARRAARRAMPAPAGPVADLRPGPLETLSARELLAALDDELARLPEPFRMAVVLCCLDGLSRDEAALRLGCSFGALKGRLERGRELLRRRLAARGVSLSAVLGGTVVLPAAVPPEVAAGATTAVVGGNARPAAVALARSLSAGQATRLVSLATVALLGLGLTFLQGGAPPGTGDPPPPRPADSEPPGETVTVKVLYDGKPVAGAKVWASGYQQDREKQPAPVTGESGPDGLARLTIPADVQSYELFARDPDGRIGELSMYGREVPGSGPSTIHLVAVGEVTGRFRTADGKPIAGVELETHQFDRTDNLHEPARPNHITVPGWLEVDYKAKSDAEGKFRIAGVPVGYRTFLSVTTDGYGRGYLMPEADKPVDVALLPAGRLRVKLAGTADPKGSRGLTCWLSAAVAGPAKNIFHSRATGELDGAAECVIANLAPGRYRVEIQPSVTHPVRGTAAAEVVIESGKMSDVTVTLEVQARMTGRVVDADTGKGMGNVPVYLERTTDRQPVAGANGEARTDADGRFEGYGPPGQWVRARVYRPPPGYTPSTPGRDASDTVKLDVSKPQAFPEIKLRRSVALRAVVVDVAGKPVARPEVWSGRVDPHERGPGQVVSKADGTFAMAELGPDAVVAPRVRKGDAVNVPDPVEVAKQSGPITIALSEKNACRVRGRVTDDAGRPLEGAKVGVSWYFHGLGPEAAYSTSRAVEVLTTDADGRFTSGALWPRDSYHVVVSHEQFGKAESKRVQGEPGQVHDLGTVQLVATGKAVRGKVVGTDGKPLAGITLTQRGDGPVVTTAKSGPDGSFTLTGFFDRPGFVLIRESGYRPSAVAVRPGGEPVTITLRKADEPPGPVPPMDGHEAALARFTRSLMEKLWADREQMGGYERNVFRDMCRFDPATARRWRDEEKKRTNGKVDLTHFLDEADLERNLLAMARTDLDEALARLPKKNQWDVGQVIDLAERLLADDKAKALRVAEEAAVRARALEPADRPWPLARAGDVAIRAGNAAGGKKLLAEAVDLANKLPADNRNQYFRGLVAVAVVVHDEPAAYKLIKGFANADTYNRALAGMVARLADADPKRAEAQFGKFRPGLGFAASEARLAVGFKLAATDPDRGEAVINGTPEVMYRLLGLARLATLVAAKDRPRAWKLIDRAMDGIDKNQESLRSWSNFGGVPAIAAMVAVRAGQVGHPDTSGLVARALAQRTAYGYESRKERDDQTISLATVLAFVDPAAARVLLASIAPPAEFAKRAVGESRDWLFAAALADPEHAMVVVDAIWSAAKDRRGSGAATSNTGLIELVSVLTQPGDRISALARYGSIPSIPDRPD